MPTDAGAIAWQGQGGDEKPNQRDAARDGQSPEEDAREVFMTHYLWDDREFRRYVCVDDIVCDEMAFREGLEFNRSVLAEHPSMIGYFVSPKRYGENYYTGVFVLRSERIEPLFTFFGAGIRPDDRAPKRDGVKGLGASERLAPQERRDSFYEWTGHTFRETRSYDRR
jgi:hypothetical protein